MDLRSAERLKKLAEMESAKSEKDGLVAERTALPPKAAKGKKRWNRVKLRRSDTLQSEIAIEKPPQDDQELIQDDANTQTAALLPLHRRPKLDEDLYLKKMIDGLKAEDAKEQNVTKVRVGQ